MLEKSGLSFVEASTANAVNVLFDQTEELRHMYPLMTLNHVSVLYLIAANPGISLSQVKDRLKLDSSSVSRIAGILGKYGQRGAGPFHLIDVTIGDQDRRQRFLRLTPTGRKLIEKLLGFASQEPNRDQHSSRNRP